MIRSNGSTAKSVTESLPRFEAYFDFVIRPPPPRIKRWVDPRILKSYFSLAAARIDEGVISQMNMAIAVTLDYSRSIVELRRSRSTIRLQQNPLGWVAPKSWASLNYDETFSDSSSIEPPLTEIIYACLSGAIWKKDERRRITIVTFNSPTWKKSFGGLLSYVWDDAVQAIRGATRLGIFGFSIPTTDTHFKYLLAVGLRDNISLRRIAFVTKEGASVLVTVAGGRASPVSVVSDRTYVYRTNSDGTIVRSVIDGTHRTVLYAGWTPACLAIDETISIEPTTRPERATQGW